MEGQGDSTIEEVVPSAAARSPREAMAPAEPVRLVAIDLDGTLLRSDKRLSLRVVDAVRQAARRNVQVVLASARPPRSVREIYDHLGLSTYQINYNGALIHDAGRARHVFHQPLPPKLAWQVVRFARKFEPEVVVSIEILDKWYTDRVDPTLLTETAKTRSPDYIGPLGKCLRSEVTKVMLLSPPQRMKPIHDALRERFANELAILVSDSHMIQIVHRDVDKANALAWVANDYGIRREQVMAIGDAPNDVGMLRWAGIGAAVANAWESAQLASDVIVPSNDEDGVAVALERYVLS